MADFTVPNLASAVVGFLSTKPSAGKTISASVVNDGASAYIFSGDISGSNPDFTVLIGDTLSLSINSLGHPFWIQTTSGAYSGIATVTENITNNGTESGTLTWQPTGIGTYYYVCQFHSGMNGTITVSKPTFTVSGTNEAIPSVDIDLSSQIKNTIPGWLTGRRPSSGQMYPRGVYNK